MIKFAFLEYWPWILTLPAFLGFIWALRKRSLSVIPKWFSLDQVFNFKPTLKFNLRFFSVIFLLLALMGPVWGTSEQSRPIYGKEIFFLLDVSASMNAEDIKPSRLKKAKNQIVKWVEMLKGNKMGLIVFSNVAYLQSPLTQDHNALKLFTDLIETNQFANSGTDFRKAFAKVIERFDATKNPEGQTARYVVLISDGEDFGEKFQSSIENLKSRNIKVFPVSIGTEQGAKVPKRDSGNDYFKDNDGNDAISKIQEQNLKKIASDFNTPYFSIKSTVENADDLANELSQEKSIALEDKLEYIDNNYYQWVLLLGILLWIILVYSSYEKLITI